MEFKDVKELIELVNNSELAYFEYTIGNAHIKMDKSMSRGNGESLNNSQPVKTDEHIQMVQKVDNVVNVERVVEETSSNDITGLEIKSPMVGTFYNSPSPEKPAFVEVGTKVKKGDTLCIVEAMKLMNEIESEVDGEVLKVLVNNGDMVEYGQPIFIIKEV